MYFGENKQFPSQLMTQTSFRQRDFGELRVPLSGGYEYCVTFMEGGGNIPRTNDEI